MPKNRAKPRQAIDDDKAALFGATMFKGAEALHEPMVVLGLDKYRSHFSVSSSSAVFAAASNSRILLTWAARSTPAVSTSAISEDFDTFLQLLTAQIKNQDPLAPLDSTQFVEQLATFSSLEQQVETNSTLGSIASMIGDLHSALANEWLGQDVAVSSQHVAFEGDPIEFEALNQKLNSESVQKKFYFKHLQEHWETKLEKAEQQTTAFYSEYEELKTARKTGSIGLQQQIFEHYQVNVLLVILI